MIVRATTAQLPIKKLIQCLEKNKLPVTVILGDSIVKDVKGWKLSDEKHKVVVKHFRGAKTKVMESYITSTINNIQTQSSLTLGLTT